MSPSDAKAVGTETPRSPGHTVRSRLAPSTRISVPAPTVAPLSQPVAGGPQTRPLSGAIVLVCTVYAPAYQILLSSGSLEWKWLA